MLDIPTYIDSTNGADWIEILFLLEKHKYLSKDAIESYFEEKEIKDYETILQNTWREIENRKRILSEKYFINTDLNGLTIEKSINKNIIYTFMLLLSSHYYYDETKLKNKDFLYATKLFERCLGDILNQYLGKAFVIGHPRPINKKNFKKCVKALCVELNEPFNSFYDYIPKSKDVKLDIVSWRPFDNRSGQPIILISCKCGRNWKDEEERIPLKLWTSYINFRADPLLSYAIPYIISNKSDWEIISKERGIIFDRLRILNIEKSLKDASLKREVIEWNKTQIKKLKQHYLH
jgi:hypothetical protein